MTLSPSDRIAVLDLVNHFAYAADTRQLGLLPEILTPDAEMNIGYGQWIGLNNISLRVKAILDRCEATAHMITNQRAFAAPGGARSTSYVTAWHWLLSDGPVDRAADFVFVAVYSDDFVPTADGWRLSRRHARRLGPTALAMGDTPDFMLAGD